MEHSKSKNSQVPRFVAFQLGLLLASPVIADDNSLWLGYQSTQYEYFEDAPSELRPSSSSIGYSRIFADNWQIALSYSQSEKNDRWPVPNTDFPNLFNQARVEQDSYAVSVGWLNSDYIISVSIAELNNTEAALSRLPAEAESIESKERVFSTSFNSSTTFLALDMGWSIGVQYIDSDNDVLQASGSDPITFINGEFDQTQTSLFTDVDFSYWFENEVFSWAPQISLGWTWEISSEGEPLALVIRGDEQRILPRLNDRIADTLRTPDSGYWELSANFDWKNGWFTTLSYGQTISAPQRIDSFSLDLGIDF
ncbi:MAG: hypothetical protein OQJ89_10415 [Kangiellaceae bacterium]|nr:hypothetical protein [Kangiellaceae bacterium]